MNTPSNQISRTGNSGQNVQAPKKRGCFFYGCLTAIIALIVLIVASYLGTRMLVKHLIDNYTDPNPISIPTVSASQDRYTQIRDRITNFIAAVKAQTKVDSLVLTSDDLNTLIALEPKLKDLRDKIYIDLKDDQIGGKVSLPLSEIGLGQGYLNGEAAFNVILEYGLLTVTLQKLNVNGHQLPEAILSSLAHQNLAKDLYKDPETIENLKKLKTIRVTNGKLIVEAK